MTRTIIAARIRAYRTARGWSQSALAAQMGITQASIDCYERGLVDMPISRLVHLAALFDCTVNDFLDDTAPAPVEVAP